MQEEKAENSQLHKIEMIGAIAGIASALFYFGAAVLPLPDNIGRLLGFGFPLLMIVAFLGLHHFLKKTNHTPSLEIAYLFGVIGASIALSLIVVQQANIMWHEAAMAGTHTEETKEILQATFRGANRVQAGLDVAFDIFITISAFLFGLNIARSRRFNKPLGWSGSLVALMLLIFNLYTFPNGPAEAGLIDLGPFLGLWFLVLYVWMMIVLRTDN